MFTTLLYNFFGDKMYYIIVLDLILKDKDINIKELAQKTNLSESYLYRIIKGKIGDISLKKLCLIANALGVDVKKTFYTNSDLIGQKKLLHKSINKYGLNNKITIRHSKILDKLLVLKLKNDIKK